MLLVEGIFRREELRVLVAHRAGRLVAVLPCYRERRLGAPRLRLLGDGVVGSDYLGPIAARPELAAACDAFADHLTRRERDAVLDLVAADNPLVTALAGGQPRGGAPRLPGAPRPAPTSCSRAAAPELPALARRIAGRRRLSAASSPALARAAPGLFLRVAVAPAEVSEALETLLLLHRARWAEAGGGREWWAPAPSRSIAPPPHSWPHVDGRGIHLLEVEGAPRAALYGFGRGGRFSFYQSGLDPAWRQPLGRYGAARCGDRGVVRAR